MRGRRRRRVAVVTGANGGIGAAVVNELVKDGWRVLATDIKLSDRRRRIRNVHYFGGNAADPEDMRRAVEEATTLGTLKACIANAGVLGENFCSFATAEPSAWRATFETNVLGVLTTFQAATRVFLELGGGRLLATSSVAGVRSEPNVAAYSASKAAVNSVVRSLALELGPENITVNAVAPGPVETPRQLELIRQRAKSTAGQKKRIETSAQRFERYRMEGRPIARLATPKEIAGVFSWLLSDAAEYITGQVLVVDGGGVLV